jgi:hypothetical protein
MRRANSVISAPVSVLRRPSDKSHCKTGAAPLVGRLIGMESADGSLCMTRNNPFNTLNLRKKFLYLSG